MSSVFRFKQFSVEQEGAAMKVGTDGVLLGAWAPLPSRPGLILDIGSGGGLIALMLAQRSGEAQIDAVEPDPEAFEQCVQNFEASPWADRLFCYHCTLQEFAGEIDDRYDAIVSNPPFHPEQVGSEDPVRDRARRQEFLPFEALLEGVVQLLSDEGVFSAVLPHAEEGRFVQLAGQVGLVPAKILRVRGRADRPLKRSLIAFVRPGNSSHPYPAGPPETGELIIEETRHQYTEAYKNLTREFYLKM